MATKYQVYNCLLYSQRSMTTDTPGTDVINNLYLYYTCNFCFVQHERTVTVENVKKIIPDYFKHVETTKLSLSKGC